MTTAKQEPTIASQVGRLALVALDLAVETAPGHGLGKSLGVLEL